MPRNGMAAHLQGPDLSSVLASSLTCAATEADLVSCYGWHSHRPSTDVDKTRFFKSLACFLNLAHFFPQPFPVPTEVCRIFGP